MGTIVLVVAQRDLWRSLRSLAISWRSLAISSRSLAISGDLRDLRDLRDLLAISRDLRTTPATLLVSESYN